MISTRLYIDVPYPIYITDLRADCEDLDDVQVRLEIIRREDWSIVKRTIHTPVSKLNDAIGQPKPDCECGLDPNPHWLERLVNNPSDVDCLPFLLPKPSLENLRDVVTIQAAIGEQGLLNLGR